MNTNAILSAIIILFVLACQSTGADKVVTQVEKSSVTHSDSSMELQPEVGNSVITNSKKDTNTIQASSKTVDKTIASTERLKQSDKKSADKKIEIEQKEKSAIKDQKIAGHPIQPKPTTKIIPDPPEEKAILFFPDTLFNFGFIDEGDTIDHTFRFLNNGTAPLEILDVKVSCGCTVPVFPLEAIQPGRLSKIDVTFLSKGKIGSQLATIDVLTNAENSSQTLYLKGVVR